MEENLWTSIKELFLLPEFDNSSPSATRDQEICPSHVLIRWWLNWILWMRFTWCPNLMFLDFLWLERQIFKLAILLSLSNSKLIVILLLGKSKLNLLVHLSDFAGHSYFIDVGQDVALRKTTQPSPLEKKIQEPCIGSGTSHFQWFSQLESRTEFSS